MVLQNKHKKLASKRWNKARGNPIRSQQDRNGHGGRPDAVEEASGGSGSGSESEEDGSEGDDESGDGEEQPEDFPDLPPAGGPNSHMKPPAPRTRPAQAPVDPKFARRKLTSNADRYAEPEPDPYEEGPVEPTSEDEREAHAKAILEQHRLKPARPDDDDDAGSEDEDVDHALLARLAGAKLGVGRGIRRPTPAKQVRGELDLEEDKEAMAAMLIEKEKADAVADVKARLLGTRFAEPQQKPDRSARHALGRRTGGTPTVKQVLEAESVDDFLDSL